VDLLGFLYKEKKERLSFFAWIKERANGGSTAGKKERSCF
jgi:hypothetical protein